MTILPQPSLGVPFVKSPSEFLARVGAKRSSIYIDDIGDPSGRDNTVIGSKINDHQEMFITRMQSDDDVFLGQQKFS
ncbi:hypothetical protein ACHAW5_005768 [Stephanodiscus triporus]|uniref:Uncharacterized protein n=1 Tax=Stephanodiscus triporus TaxID=2934178 RepID=A0ABD3MF26_9STRA